MTDANETAKEEAIKIPDVLPVLPLKDLVIFPFIIVPLSVSREKSINAVDQALAENRVIMLTAQKDFQNEDPGEEDLYRTGTVAIIMRMLKLPDGRIRILVQGLSRARIDYFIQTAPFFKAKITRIEEPVTKDKGLEVEALIRAVKQNLDRAVSLGKNISPEVMVIAANLDDPARSPISPRRISTSSSKKRRASSRPSTPSSASRRSTTCSPARSTCSPCSRRSRPPRRAR